MNNILVVFASQTIANRVKSILYKNYGVKASLIQTPTKLKGSVGCSYCLRLNREDSGVVKKIIDTNNLSSKGFFDANTYSKIYVR